jgi:hypothetical protein
MPPSFHGAPYTGLYRSPVFAQSAAGSIHSQYLALRLHGIRKTMTVTKRNVVVIGATGSQARLRTSTRHGVAQDTDHKL